MGKDRGEGLRTDDGQRDETLSSETLASGATEVVDGDFQQHVLADVRLRRVLHIG